ncbi:uncharacterized protein LOC129147489 [Eptesicus fuscus]|uniref:uncharacterized protein LOC129147489 n=1 Tax=Eptesicus fuscus TaxID=29078 RepID=UPI0024047B75|nr:uncharacterized protein LOC129147489 [Eptesicus fuscus]
MKRNEKKKHLERPYNIQQDAPQLRSFIAAPGCSQYSSDGSSENSSCDSSSSNLGHHDADGFYQLQQNVPYLGELNMRESLSACKRKIMDWYQEGSCNFQQIVPHPLSFMKFLGCSQAAEENTSSSEKYSCDYSSSNLSEHDEDGTCTFQQDVPQHQSFMEAPGCSQEEEESTSSSEESSCDSSSSNLGHHDEDGFQQLQQNVPYLGKRNKPVSQFALKRKMMDWYRRGFQQLQQNVPYLGKRNKPVSQFALKRKMMDCEVEFKRSYFADQTEGVTLIHGLKARKASSSDNVSSISCKDRLTGAGPSNIQQDTPRPESHVEAPGCSQEGRENTSSSEYCSCVSSSYELPCYDEDGLCNIQQDAPQLRSFIAAPGCSQYSSDGSSENSSCDSSSSNLGHHDADGFFQLQQNVPYLGELNMRESLSACKRKIMDWYQEGSCNFQQIVPHPLSFMKFLGCSQAAEESTNSSEKYSCDYSSSNLSEHDEDGTCTFQQDVPQHQPFMEAPGCSQEEEESTSSSEESSCDSSSSNLCHDDEDGFQQLQQNVPYLGKRNKPVSKFAWKRKMMDWYRRGSHLLQQIVPYLGKLNKPVSRSARKWKIMEGPIGGPSNIQQDTPRPESHVEAPGCSQEGRENTSSSEYYSCVSSSYELPRYDEDGIKERRVPKNLVQTESSSDYSYSSNSSHSSSNKEPGLMKIYYMRVQMKRGVAALCNTGEGWEPPSKKIKMEEMTYTTEVHKNVPLSHMSGENLLNDPEPSVDSPAQEKREKAGCSAEPPNLVAYRRIPLWRALESGFRCLACCRVFASLEALQGHVEHGVQEGFSCHVFHRAMARLKYKKLKRKKKKLMKATLSCQEKKHFDRKTNLKN